MNKSRKLIQFVKKYYTFFYLFSVCVIIVFASIGLAFVKNFRALAPGEVENHSNQSSEPTEELAPEEVRQEITKSPPKHSGGGNITGTAQSNPDGSTTVTVSTGSTDPSDQSKAASAGPSSSIADVDFIDYTGSNANLESQLKDYMSQKLLIKDEISSLYAIIVKNAGDTGWAGLFSGSYTIQPNGDITSAWGYITLNTYYYQSSPYFTDYMKLVFSHEYGHHYTLYHKWVHWDLVMNTRFPDSYYTVRPLPKATTTYDYSLGWSNCDAEIIAEDYAYLYSGYGYHAMSSTYGYPSATTKTWLVNEPSGSSSLPTADQPPAITITSPADGATVSGSLTFSADVSDDYGVIKVNFYLDDSLLFEDSALPYSTILNSAVYSNGAHTLKVVATDSSNQTTERSTSVIFYNPKPEVDQENPTIQITRPTDNPYSWTSGNLLIQASASDNVAVQKIELYINNVLVATENSDKISRIWPWNNVGPGTYTLKAKSYDTANNTAETSLVINKSG